MGYAWSMWKGNQKKTSRILLGFSDGTIVEWMQAEEVSLFCEFGRFFDLKSTYESMVVVVVLRICCVLSNTIRYDTYQLPFLLREESGLQQRTPPFCSFVVVPLLLMLITTAQPMWPDGERRRPMQWWHNKLPQQQQPKEGYAWKRASSLRLLTLFCYVTGSINFETVSRWWCQIAKDTFLQKISFAITYNKYRTGAQY